MKTFDFDDTTEPFTARNEGDAWLIDASRQKQFGKGEIALKHAIGLGHQPIVVPVTSPVLDGPPRPVEVGWHPVAGPAGKWFAEDTSLGKIITQKVNEYPDPTQHWAVLVGDYAHQLWMDEDFYVIYINEKFNRNEWRTFKVGDTRFNDDAIRRTGEMVIESIREAQPAYNVITNNCQTYALQLLDAIDVSVEKEFGTTRAVFERMFGRGKVIDLFSDTEAPPAQGEPIGPPKLARSDTISMAQQVMNDNTDQLGVGGELKQSNRQKGGNTEASTASPDGSKETKKPKRKILSFFKRS
ncbi:uncharacterized protein F5Z01DRAFT_745923 [Emericellopsis atlantica]|uniref:DUF862-domain-containing protein n=1 Tax=Emericellopsis atlantica TaxID=2614577 RepID=A0A9P8CLN6_9HYPO|nr:uncharacterized protein F5Z01DRAFT_745923 [Emericellopsis atlantica]KAG9249796.1 hypothetical protein F5Z01DRAFT_745923 [Emericellopsis atlantica]